MFNRKIISIGELREFESLKREEGKRRDKRQEEYTEKWNKIPDYEEPFECKDCGFKSRVLSDFVVFKKGFCGYYKVYVCKKCAKTK